MSSVNLETDTLLGSLFAISVTYIMHIIYYAQHSTMRDAFICDIFPLGSLSGFAFHVSKMLQIEEYQSSI